MICRYHVPHDPQGATEVCEDCITQARSIGSEYLNGYVAILASLVKWNHDLRFLNTNVDYTVKYTTKHQGPVDSDRALTTVLNAISRSNRSRSRAEDQDPDLTPEQIGKARVRSLLFNVTNHHQIHNTLLIACMLRKDQPFFVSHRRVLISLRPLISFLTGDDVTIAVRRTSDGGACGSLVVTKYLHRPTKSMALFPFLSGGHHLQRSQRQTEEKGKTEGGLFDDEAMEDEDEDEDDGEDEDKRDDGDVDEPAVNESSTSTPEDYIVVIHGFSFKPEARRTTHEKRESHAQAALLLFVPFHTLDSASLLGGYDTYQEAFSAALRTGTVCSAGVKYLNNVELFWKHKIASQERTIERNKKIREEAEKLLEDPELKLSKCRRSKSDGEEDDDDKNFRSDSDSDDYDYDVMKAPSASSRAAGIWSLKTCPA